CLSRERGMSGRIPIKDVAPVVDCGRRPAKAVPGEEFRIYATVFRDGHGAVGCNVVLIPDGAEVRDPPAGGNRRRTDRPGTYARMRLVGPGTDRWYADVVAPAEGDWSFVVEAWADPISTWRHDAVIKVPQLSANGRAEDAEARRDLELTLEEGAR